MHDYYVLKLEEERSDAFFFFIVENTRCLCYKTLWQVSIGVIGGY